MAITRIGNSTGISTDTEEMRHRHKEEAGTAISLYEEAMAMKEGREETAVQAAENI
jgi:hypothetical protein